MIFSRYFAGRPLQQLAILKICMDASPEPAYLYLTTTGRKSGLPREIEIWFTRQGRHYYVIAEFGHSHWLRNIQNDERVLVRLGEQRFRGKARVIDPEKEHELSRCVQELSRKKYGWGDGVIVEIAPEK